MSIGSVVLVVFLSLLPGGGLDKLTSLDPEGALDELTSPSEGSTPSSAEDEGGSITLEGEIGAATYLAFVVLAQVLPCVGATVIYIFKVFKYVEYFMHTLFNFIQDFIVEIASQDCQLPF